MRRLVLSACMVLFASFLSARGGWEDPPGGWFYVYEANEGEDAYMASYWAKGCLDGDWVRGQASDQWDGSRPGDTGTAPSGLRPGGIGVEQLTGEGEDGGDASVLSIEDIGDPRNSGWSVEPSNRKFFLLKDASNDLSLDEGVTMCMRMRLNPSPVEVTCGGCPDFGNGMTLHSGTDNKGMIGYAEQNVATINLALTDAQELNLLSLDTLDGVSPYVDIGGSATEWLVVWIAVQRVDPAANEIVVALYLNGQTDPVPGFEEASFFSIRDDYEGSGNTFTKYLNVGAGSTGFDIAWQLDYFCVAKGYHLAKIPVQGCPSGLADAVDGANVNLTWDNRGVTVQSFKIERSGTVLEAAYPGSNTSYTDAAPAPGVYQYTVTPTITGQTCAGMESTVNMCIRGLACTVVGQTVRLNWASGATYSGVVIERNGVGIATIGGTETSFTETLTEGGDYTYGVKPASGTCAIQTCAVSVASPIPPETADFNPPEGGWGYVYDPTPTSTVEEMRKYDPVAGSFDPGRLDGLWARSGGSDMWDGSAPGEVDTTTDVDSDGDLDGAAPGGIALDVVAGGAPGGGGDAGVLSFEDVGNPSVNTFLWNGTPRWWEDAPNPAVPLTGSNRKSFMGHNFNDLCDDPLVPDPLIDLGMTFNVRLRLTPPGMVKDFAGAGLTAPLGMGLQGDGKGYLCVYWNPEVETAEDPVRKLGLTMFGDGQGDYYLVVNIDSDTADVPEEDRLPIFLGNTAQTATQFVNLWMTIERPDEAQLVYRVSLYMNGDTDLFMQKDIVLSPGGREADAGWGNAILMGSKATDAACAFQVDFVKIAAGVHPPATGPTGVGVFTGNANGDNTVNIADAVTILGYLFGKPPKPVIPCFKAADSNDDDTINVADAIDVLTFLFGAQTNPSKPMTGPDGSAVSTAACRLYPANTIPATILGQPGCATQCK